MRLSKLVSQVIQIRRQPINDHRREIMTVHPGLRYRFAEAG